MPPNPSSRCLLLACISAAAIFAWQEFIIHFRYDGQQSALFFTGGQLSVPPPLQAGTYLFQNSTGYDGQFYRYVAHDPFFRRYVARNVDDPRSRYGRILVPILAWAVSGGQDRFIDRAYQFIVVALCTVGVYWTCCWLSLSGCPPIWGVLAFLLLPATLASIERLLVDGPMCALFAGQLYYTRLGRGRAMYIIAALAPLIRETGILILAGILAAAAFGKCWKRFAVFATAALPTAAWTLYVAAHTGPTGAMHNFARPVFGLFVRLLTVSHDYPGSDKSLYVFMQTIDFLALAGYIFCLALAAKWLWVSKTKWCDPIKLTIAFFLFMALLMGHPEPLMSAYAYGRTLSPLILWVALLGLASRKWAALVPPLLVSAGVAIYPAYSTLRAIGA